MILYFGHLDPQCRQYLHSNSLLFPDILKGSVGILNNYNLCHIKTIQWDEIITGAPESRYVYVYNFKEPERECSPCHESCQVSIIFGHSISIRNMQFLVDFEFKS